MSQTTADTRSATISIVDFALRVIGLNMVVRVAFAAGSPKLACLLAPAAAHG
jgi:hypothetical protein